MRGATLSQWIFSTLLFTTTVRTEGTSPVKWTTASAIPTASPFSIPIIGPSANLSMAWGITTSDSYRDPLIEIHINKSIGWTEEYPTTIFESLKPPNELAFFEPWRGEKVLVLAPDNFWEVVMGPAGTKAWFRGPVVDMSFGLQLGDLETIDRGLVGRYNGSLTINGHYDSNRINSTAWMPLPKAVDLNRNSTFFSNNGSIQFYARVHANNDTHSSEDELVVNLSFSEEAIVLPYGYLCSNLSIEPQHTTPSYPIRVLDYHVRNDTRCRTRSEGYTSSDKDVVVLGKPFFKAAYMYVLLDGSVYLAQGNDYNLPRNPVKFDAKAELKPPAPPQEYESPPGSVSTGAILAMGAWRVPLVMSLLLALVYAL